MKLIANLSIALVTLTACSPAANENRMVGELTSDRIELTTETSEPIVGIDVVEGATVSAGQLLLRQDSTRVEARQREARASLQQSKARLDELMRGPRSEQIAAARANLEGADKDLQFRQTELERVTEIHARNLASAEDMDRASAALDAARANRKLRVAQLDELLTGTTAEVLAQAQHVFEQAQARLDAATVDVRRHELRAPVDGLLDSRLFEIGERPAAGQPVLILLAGEQSHARIYVPEHLRVRISPGMPARIFVDGLDSALNGRVRWVASEPAFTPYFALTERDRGRLSYAAKVDFTEQHERLPDGVPVEVEFDLD
ncbi:MAG: HlyD family efflux transporter periplasmic adaptor subunit [Gammaproteobacteria bacterium]|nr:HlyD family efflux transporter periplasmic adaptor subunit [Gammaproteobacteria bacterium]